MRLHHVWTTVRVALVLALYLAGCVAMYTIGWFIVAVWREGL